MAAVGWAVPEAVYVDFDVIRAAPPLLNRSGVGDVLCYHTAHYDWKLAHDSGREERRWPYDERLVDRGPRAARRPSSPTSTRSARSATGGSGR